jgi:phosphoglucosamine mutase
VNLQVRAKPPLETLPRLQASLREADDAFGDRGRHLIRYSGTENKVRILVEHRDDAVVAAWSARLRGVIEQELA